MGFADIANTVLDFVRQHPNWAAFVVFRSVVRGINALRFFGTPILGGFGWHWYHHRRRRPTHLLDDCRRGGYRCSTRRLARVLDRLPLSRADSTDVAVEKSPQAFGQGPHFLQALGCVGNSHRPVLRTVARKCPDSGRHCRDAMASVPDSKLEFCVSVGVRSAFARLVGDEMVDAVLVMNKPNLNTQTPPPQTAVPCPPRPFQNP
jgi:hypothetical protein